MTARPADVCVSGSGSVFLFLLLTVAAREWVAEHVSPDRQFLGDDLAVEWRYAPALVEGMQGDGLTVEAIDHHAIGREGADCSWQETGRL